MAELGSAVSVAKQKRKRICVSQSKRGCLTCKYGYLPANFFPVLITCNRARRVKCDEGRPFCRRCIESARACEGYTKQLAIKAGGYESSAGASEPRGASSVSKMTIQLPLRSLSPGLSGDERQNRYAQVGTRLLSSASFVSLGASGLVLETLVAQTCYTIPSVHAAAVALGAIYSWLKSDCDGVSTVERFALSQYRLALDAMQKDLESLQDGPIPLILACFMLSVLEIFRREEIAALIHLRGAFNLMSQAKMLKPLVSGNDLATVEDHMELVMRAIDFQTWSYAPSKDLELSSAPLPSSLSPVMDIGSIDVALVRLIHLCYEFRSKNEKFRYRLHSAAPSLYIQQGRLIAHLSMWIEQLTTFILPTLAKEISPCGTGAARNHALTLRVIALSTMISLSCILCPHQAAFDSHTAHFETIIDDCDALILERDATKEPGDVLRSLDGSHYQAGPGIIEPLFLTATKSRHPCHRRRAIRLLSTAGCEGPWIGTREACISRRIMQLEEKGDDFEKHSSDHIQGSSCGCGENLGHVSTSAAAASPETVRIHTFGLTSLCMTGGIPRKVRVLFRRCLDVDNFLSFAREQGPAFDGNADSDLDRLYQNRFWETWTEILDIQARTGRYI